MSLNHSKPKTGCLYVCATPIGNLSDLTFRAKDILVFCNKIYCEDTRNTRILCDHIQSKAQLVSLHNYNESKVIKQILSDLQTNKCIALVSDAGTPNISDPGGYVVKHVRQAGYDVVPIPGANSIVSLLSVAGIRVDQFVFGGFFPKKKQEFFKFLDKVFSLPIVFFESPKRIVNTLLFLTDQLEDMDMLVGKELTKKHERFWTSPSNLLADLKQDPSLCKGEWVFVLRVNSDLKKHIDLAKKLKQKGFSRKEVLILKDLNVLELSRNEIYKLFIS